MNGCCSSSGSDLSCYANPCEFSSENLPEKINTIATVLIILISITYASLCIANYYTSFLDAKTWNVIFTSYLVSGAVFLIVSTSICCMGSKEEAIKETTVGSTGRGLGNNTNEKLQRIITEKRALLARMKKIANQRNKNLAESTQLLEKLTNIEGKVDLYKTKETAFNPIFEDASKFQNEYEEISQGIISLRVKRDQGLKAQNTVTDEEEEIEKALKKLDAEYKELEL